MDAKGVGVSLTEICRIVKLVISEASNSYSSRHVKSQRNATTRNS